jgi:hydroxysqualene dehydroxylase
MGGTVHVIGAGVAGLRAATKVALSGRRAVVYEAAPHAGGRCRSFFDTVLERRIDNGNHLLLSGNRAVNDYLKDIEAKDALSGPEHAEFPFFDLESGQRWVLRPNDGRIPWWVFSPERRVPGSRATDYLEGLRLARAKDGDTVVDCLDTSSPLYRLFWEPLAIAILNASPDEAAASLLWPVMEETFGRGGKACYPRIATKGLSESFVDPALLFLESRSCAVLFNRRLRAFKTNGGRICGLDFGGEEISLDDEDTVVLATPPASAEAVLPGLSVPKGSRAIVNAHFLMDERQDALSFMGMVGSHCQWLFLRENIASITVSAADGLVDKPSEEIATILWPEVAKALDLGAEATNKVPVFRIVKEKRATFAQTPEEARRRPGVETSLANLFLAGDWVDTGLPATIEGALRSGEAAAKAAM